MQHEVRAGDRHHHARHPAERERHHEADRPQHGRGELDAAAVHRKQPVEDLHAGRNRDHHRHDPEKRVHVRARAHREEVVQPHEEREHHDHARRVDHRLVAEERLLRERRDHFRIDAERGQHEDVHLGMAPRPDQVQVDHRVAAGVVREEVHAEVAVEREEGERDRQDRERRHDEDVRAERGPREHGHLHQRHARRAHPDDRHEEVDRGDQRADAGYLQCPQVVIDADARTELQLRQRRIREPACLREFADDERDVHQQRGDGRHPEAQRIEERERDVARADL
ncbi:cytochrome o ubiquinol oxidase, subunit I domain protein [Burkholderia sp. ABCPW 111]|nr:cytochrome o ubiquinol oxidase, subunit I domain protein [Burkholderia sp. ABCPW 111]